MRTDGSADEVSKGIACPRAREKYPHERTARVDVHIKAKVDCRQEAQQPADIEFVEDRRVVRGNVLDGRNLFARQSFVSQEAQEYQMRERQTDIHYSRHGNASVGRASAAAQNYRQQENHHHAERQDRKQFFHIAEPRATQQQY